MTELQIGLIGLGGAAVVAVFGYNKWQEMRQRKDRCHGQQQTSGLALGARELARVDGGGGNGGAGGWLGSRRLAADWRLREWRMHGVKHRPGLRPQSIAPL